MILIRLADASDLDAVVNLRVEAEAWLHAAGIHQWIDRERGIQNLRAGINNGVTYVAEDDQCVVATLTLDGPDLDFWAGSDSPNSALYLYKFIIGERYRGTGIGDELLDWACSQAEDRGRQWLRLDCWRENIGLQRYYLRRGFTHVRTVAVEGRGSGALYQRPAKRRTTEMPRLEIKTAL